MVPLQLEVLINGQPADLIAAFFQLPDSRIAAKRSELMAIGIRSPEGPSDDILPLSEISGIQYHYDPVHQKIDILAPDSLRLPKVFNARNETTFHNPERSVGAYLNYSAFLSGDYNSKNSISEFDRASLSLDGNVFGPFGTFSQTAILTTDTSSTASLLRLDSSWIYSDPETIMSYRAGDLISGGLEWTRPIRIGGVQLQRDFSLRPDLITMPLPSFAGSAAVPSTLDVYIGGVKTYSTDVPSGPYLLNNIPIVSGGGIARLVVTDSSGRQIQSESSLYTNASLLREGIYDYSVEAGLPRLNYGLPSSSYNDRPVISASAREGLTDQVTLESHVELGYGLSNLGAGAVFSVGPLGLISTAVAISHQGANTGELLYGALDLPAGQFNLHLSTERTVGDYRDLASIIPLVSGVILPNLNVPRAVDQIAAGYSFPDSQSSLSFSAIHTDQGDGTKTMILSVTFSQLFSNEWSFFATGFHDLDSRNSFGVSAGLSIPLGPSESSSVGVSDSNQGISATADVVKSIGTDIGDTGGRFTVSAGANEYVSAYGDVRLRSGLLESSITQQGTSVNAYTAYTGSLVLGQEGVFAAQQINGAFAIVGAGAPGVKVLLENNPVGETDSGGELLVTNLIAYQENKLSIGIGNLPLDADAPITELRVVPAEHSGVAADFRVQQSVPSAEVVFTRTDGSFVEAGTRGFDQATNQPFVVGYDGRAYIKGLAAQNTVSIVLENGQCKATFPFAKKANSIAVIGPVICR